MATGKTHDSLGVLVSLFFLVGLFLLQVELINLLAFEAGFLFSLFIFSPDTDLGPKKRLGWLGLWLYPYRLYCKHRGLSHHPLWGTLLRLLYLVLLVLLVLGIMSFLGLIQEPWQSFWDFLVGYRYGGVYQLLTWFILGVWMGDMTHLFWDMF